MCSANQDAVSAGASLFARVGGKLFPLGSSTVPGVLGIQKVVFLEGVLVQGHGSVVVTSVCSKRVHLFLHSYKY